VAARIFSRPAPLCTGVPIKSRHDMGVQGGGSTFIDGDGSDSEISVDLGGSVGGARGARDPQNPCCQSGVQRLKGALTRRTYTSAQQRPSWRGGAIGPTVSRDRGSRSAVRPEEKSQREEEDTTDRWGPHGSHYGRAAGSGCGLHGCTVLGLVRGFSPNA
jgi:hypothetical protein